MAGKENKKKITSKTKRNEELEVIGESKKGKRTRRRKKNKRPYGPKEKAFIVTSFVIAICVFLFYGYRSLKYYSRETSNKKADNVTIASAVINNNKITKEKDGLRAMKRGYYFSGKVENNYVKAFNRLYRIIDIDTDKVKIVSADNEAIFIYGDENQYSSSNLYKWLNKTEEENTGIYYNSIPGIDKLLTKTEYCDGHLY